MKKKILIVNKSFELGGIQSSMVNMANELSQFYEVDLFIYNPEGVMRERLSDKVKVLDSSWRFKCLGMSLSRVFKTGNLKMIFFRLFASVWSKLFSNRLPIDMAIRKQKKMIGYDLAIAYHQEQRRSSVVSGFVRVVDRCVEASRKAAWLHFDSDTIDLDSRYNNPFYQKMDRIVCVSRSLMENFARKYSELCDKMDYCYNFVLYDAIKDKSLLEQDIPFPSDKFVCFSACRLTEEKAIVRAVNSIADVFKSHPDLVWYIAGDGVEREKIEAAIKENSLEGRIVLLGHKNNPYPYMRGADLMMNVSYHEAAPMIFLESRAIGTPVFATRTASADEFLCDGVDSFVCENSDKGIRERFAWLVDNRALIENAKRHLEEYESSNENSFSKILKMTTQASI